MKPLNKIKLLAGSAAGSAMLIATRAYGQSTSGAETKNTTSIDNIRPDNAAAGNLPVYIENILNTLIIVAGVVSVLVIVIGGIRYALAQGDEKNVKSAKDTILFAIIGLVISLLAFSIVNFVIKSLF